MEKINNLAVSLSKNTFNIKEVNPYESATACVKLRGQILKCSSCEYRTFKKHRMLNHFQVHREEVFDCDDCDYSCWTSSSMRYHKATKHSQRHVCPICNKGFGIPYLLQNHLKLKHGDEATQLKCKSRKIKSGCTRRSTIGSPKESNSEETEYWCEECSKRLQSRESLSKHMKRHNGDLRHMCEFCGKRFMFPYILADHIRTHDKTKPFSCADCGFRVSSKLLLRKHRVNCAKISILRSNNRD